MTILLGVTFLLLLACSAFFSSAETAYFSIDPLQLRRITEQRPATGESLRAQLANPTRLLSTILIGNTLVNLAMANVGYLMAEHWIPAYSEAVTIPAVTILLVFFGEVGPKNIGLLHTALIVRFYGPGLRFFEWLLAPLRYLLDFFSRRLAHLFQPSGKTLSEEEFETVLDISREEGILNADELAMIKAIVDLEDLHASDVMTPRVDFLGLDLDDPSANPVAAARQARRNFLILYRSQFDEIAGFLDVRKFLLDPAHSLSAATVPPVYVPESVPLNRLLSRFQKDRIRIAVVVDEYGGVAGIVTRGDILEEITGDIYNELSKPRPIFQSAGPYAWLVDANISLEEINRKLRLDLQADTSDRLAGWITEHLGSVPKQDDVVQTQGVRVRVMQTIRLRVTLAHIEKLDGPREGDPA
ncbi:MAG: HlyC/CorC family transporter [Kiritimatiellae bacterium]|mgnify:CR=1 FL=1|jgi:putative hemolysin|nr:HlyC/CorC family transporter [Kiritimatiellia bacterium]NLD90418.1 HlyC/CorC family transporter [Lentisphaerota bacterium]HPC20496.1 hemolysin family protein [Kiritimatiellia bacterium]HQQ61210.1 hemolysin family protein [Kiritimatiellia bacterium]